VILAELNFKAINGIQHWMTASGCLYCWKISKR